VECTRCHRPSPTPNARFCVFCGGPLAERVERPRFRASRRAAAFDWWLSAGVLVGLVAGDALVPGPWWGLALGLVMPIYVLVEGIRLRRVWLCGALGAGMTLAFLLLAGLVGLAKLGVRVLPHSIGAELGLWWRGISPTPGVVLVAPAWGALGMAVAWVAGRLAQPLSAALLERRMGALMVGGAFSELGLAEAVSGAVGRGQEASAAKQWGSSGPPAGREGSSAPAVGWLDARQRERAVGAALGALRRLSLPRIAVGREEARSGQARRLFPVETCADCGGKGMIACPDCRGGGRAPGLDGDEPPARADGGCFRCAGKGTVLCECVEAVSFRIPAGAPSGFIVRGECSAAGHRHYATVHSTALPRPKRPLPVLLMGILGIPAGVTGAIGFGVVASEEPSGRIACALLSLACGLWALAAIPLLVRARLGWALMRAALVVMAFGGVAVLVASPVGITGLMQEGVPVELLALLVFLLAVVTGLVALVQWWHTAPVTAHFGDRGQLVPAAAPALLPGRDRVAKAATSGPARAVAWVAGVSIVGWLLLNTLGGSYWTMARAGIAAYCGGGEQAVWLYEEAAGQARSGAQRRRAVSAGNRAALRALEDAVAEWGENGPQSADAYQMVMLCRSLGDRASSLTRQQSSRAAALMLTAAELLMQRRLWEDAGDVLEPLVNDFPGSAQAKEVVGRSEWRFCRVKGVTVADKVPLGPYIAGVSGFGGIDVQHDYLKPSSGNTLAMVRVEVAHVGRTPKELLASSFSLTGAGGRGLPAAGIQRDDYAEGYDLHFLEPMRTYDGLSIGPEMVEASVVFEVPQEERKFILYVGAERATEVAIGGRAAAAVTW